MMDTGGLKLWSDTTLELAQPADEVIDENGGTIGG